MSRRHTLVKFASVSFGMSLALTGCGAVSSGNSQSGGNNTATNQSAQVVHVDASNFKWTLDKTSLSAGQPIQFDITSKEGTHAFAIVGTSVSQVVSPGQDTQVTWTPPKAGTYTIRCNIYCGSGHENMFTSFAVK